jgi:hypothetical protein
MTIDAWMQHPTVRFSEHELYLAGNARRVFALA